MGSTLFLNNQNLGPAFAKASTSALRASADKSAGVAKLSPSTGSGRANKMRFRNPFSRQNILILTPLILVMILDLIFTLAGQPDFYWQNYNLFNEGNPLGPILMSYHPIYFILFFIFYLLFVSFLATNLIRPLNIMMAIGLFLGHSWGSSSWVPTIFYKLTGIYLINDWYLIIGYFIIIAIISGFCINRWLKIKNLK